jgi:hypothetical protein
MVKLSSPLASQDASAPLSVMVIKSLIIGLGIILAAGFAGLIIMLTITFYKMSLEKQPSLWLPHQTVVLEEGQDIAGTSVSGKYVLIETKKSGKPDRLLIHDAQSGHLTSTIHFTYEKSAAITP